MHHSFYFGQEEKPAFLFDNQLRMILMNSILFFNLKYVIITNSQIIFIFQLKKPLLYL